MNQRQSGLTLIELIVVIVILGILSATAISRFTTFKNAAALAAVQSVAGSLESGSALNHAVAIADKELLVCTVVGVDGFTADFILIGSAGMP